MKTHSGKKVVCIAGKNNVACDSLTFLAKNNLISIDNIITLPNFPEEETSWMKSLRITAHSLGVRVVENVDAIREIDDLVFISLEYNRIVHPSKFSSKELFNIHFSKLPVYKGMYTSVWPILNGENNTGVTLHKIDHGIDTGDIIDQIEFPIHTTDTCRDLYFKYNEYGTELFKANICSILEKSYRAEPQPSHVSSYYSKKSISYENLEIDLNKTAFEVHNQIRAFIFPEYQLPEVHGYKIIKSKITNKRSILKAGEIVSEAEELIEISTIDYDVRLYKKMG